MTFDLNTFIQEDHDDGIEYAIAQGVDVVDLIRAKAYRREPDTIIEKAAGVLIRTTIYFLHRYTPHDQQTAESMRMMIAEAVGDDNTVQNSTWYWMMQEVIEKNPRSDEARVIRHGVRSVRNLGEGSQRAVVATAIRWIAPYCPPNPNLEWIMPKLDVVDSPVVVKKALDQVVVGQEEAKRSLSMALFNYTTALRAGIRATETTLLIGPTGCGKTLLAKTLADIAGLPCVVVDASQLTQDGWKGINKDRIFELLNKEKKGHGDYMSGGIVVLDEFDKLCKPSYTAQGSNVSALVQGCILGMLDGMPVSSEAGKQYDTDKILYILTGAFADLREHVTQRESVIGFESYDKQKTAISLETIRDYLVESGMIPELAGRIANIALLKDLTADEIYTAVTQPAASAIKTYEKILAASGKVLKCDDEYLHALAQEAAEAGLGVRGCRNTISEKLRESMYRAYEQNDTQVYFCR